MSEITPEQLYCFNPHTGKRDGGFCVWEGTGKCLQCQAADRIATLEKVIADCNGCIQAARIEGLDEALAETSDERLKDLVVRRLLWVEHYCAGYLGGGE